jgi:hypothetical protein
VWHIDCGIMYLNNFFMLSWSESVVESRKSNVYVLRLLALPASSIRFANGLLLSISLVELNSEVTWNVTFCITDEYWLHDRGEMQHSAALCWSASCLYELCTWVLSLCVCVAYWWHEASVHTTDTRNGVSFQRWSQCICIQSQQQYVLCSIP